MPRRWVLWTLFLSSYMPLFALLALRSFGHSNPLALACTVFVALGAIGTVVFLRTARSKTPGDFELLDVENRDSDVSAYAATYLLPFLVIFGGPWQDIVSLIGFVAFLGVVYVRSRLIYVNPTLALFGFRLWRVIPLTAGATEAERKVVWPRFLLARTDLIAKGQMISARRVTDDLLLFDSDRTSVYANQ
jgi:hypothetical protein